MWSCLLVAPLGDQLAVLHVGFGVLLTKLDTGELHEKTVSDVVRICRLVGLGI